MSGKHHSFRLLSLIVLLAATYPALAADGKTPAPDIPPAPPPATYQQTDWPKLAQTACCKTCRKGKACGNSCISKDKTCTRPPGCACNAP